MTRDRRMKGVPFPFNATAWLEDDVVSKLELDALGAFVFLLAHSWNADGLDNDVAAIGRQARATPKAWARIWKQLAPLWPLDEMDNRRRNPRQERDRDDILDTKAKRGAASIAANEAKKALRSRTDSDTATVTDSDTDSFGNRKPKGARSGSDSTPERTVIGSSSLTGTQLQSPPLRGVVPQGFGPELQTEAFKSAWTRWCAHLSARKGREITFSREELEALGARLRGWGHDAALAAIEHSICSGWASIQAPVGADRGPNRSPNRNGNGRASTVDDEFEKAFPGLAEGGDRG